MKHWRMVAAGSPWSWLVLLLGVAAAVAAARLVAYGEQRSLDRQFSAEIQRISLLLEERVRTHEQILRGGVGLFEASTEVTREEWRTYVNGLELPTVSPGLQGVGYAVRLHPAEIEAHELRARSEGFPAYRLYPQGERPEYVVISYLEPRETRNLRAYGYDMYSEPVRRAALDQARDTGRPTLSGPVVLVQEEEGQPLPGVLLYLPVYRQGALLAEVKDRREALVGYVYAPMRMGDLITATLGPWLRDIDLAISDVSPGDGSHRLLYGRPDAGVATADAGLPRAVREMSLHGRVWRLSFTARPTFAGGVSKWPLATLLAGLGAALMAFLTISSIESSGRRARALAMDMTKALRESAAYRQAILDSSADGIITIDANGIVQSLNRAGERMFGYSEEEILGRNVSMLMPERFRARHDGYVANFRPEQHGRIIGLRREVTGRRRDGSEFPMSLAVNGIQAEGARRFVGVVGDISERKRIEAELAELTSLRQSILDGAAVAIIATDTSGVITAVNPAAERLLWYGREEMIGQLTLSQLHDPQELGARADALTKDLGERVGPGLEALVAKARRGLVDENEWTYVRKGGSGVPVQATVTVLRGASGQVNGYLAVAFDITERKRQEDYIRHIAQHDALTQLPNRMLLQDRLQVAIARARRDSTQIGLLMVDLDHFKRINDSLGHHVGDQVLLAVAERLNECVRECDSVARMGGDEFVVLVADIRDGAAVRRIARSLVDAFAAPVVVGSHELHLSASIGISCYPEDGTDVSSLLKNADTAMYQVKAAGRAGYQRFNPDMMRAANEKLSLESSLRHALARGEFAMHYEPQINLANGEVIGVEALIRWRHPQRGMVSPGEFIPLAEETGLIVPIGEWTLRTACAEVRALQQRLGQRLTVAVNLSPRQFAQPNLVEQVQAALTQSGLDPRDLVLEITEGSLMAKSVEIIHVLKRLRALGVSIAVDDFGTGYSSLSYITRFPIDILKIDRSFVADICDDPADAAVARAIVAMAHGLGISVIAEGVETAEQLEYLRNRTCDGAQGFLIGRATPASSFSVQGYHFTQALPAADVPSKVVELRTHLF